MASNQPAYAPARPGTGTGTEAAPRPGSDGDEPAFAFFAESPRPSSDAAPKMPRQRNMARGGTVLGIAAMAAVGAGGVAAAAAPAAPGTAPVAISVPDVAPFEDAPAPAPAVTPSVISDPGEALRARIIGTATAGREAAAQAERDAAARAAAEQAAREAAARKVREQAAAAKAEAEAKAKADAEAAAKAEAERLAALARSYIKPVTSATPTDGFGQADPWSPLHAGQDFAAPTGTPVHAVHGGTVTSAGWAGAQGYRVVVTLDDGTQVWYCHLSTMCVTQGGVTTGDTVGRVGATGNVTTPHLHLEVRPGGGAPVDPLPWLHGHGVTI
ncbi:M23 family metallopeptidase [Actinacidiphila rubida]|uniref:Peptidase family M23 n=1 Tax=Actinacidiphila rubida TaxID=310780 RepID=A0A1H8Q6W5_9ACTN|nr:M23 family metallopeptidase [Actinacidiphila rubida]SEO49975.1 Peptidase family M23 [Actinacidiphila rubida]